LGAFFNEKYFPNDLGAIFSKMPPKIHLNDFGYFISENSQIFIGNFFG
jgi:hypothetical protein